MRARQFATGLFALALLAAVCGGSPAVLQSRAATPKMAAPKTAVPAQSALAIGRAKLARGQYKDAVKYLESAVKQAPRSCEANLCLGQAYLKLRNYLKAKAHLRTAVRVGQGSVNAQKANACLMQLPKDLIAPRTGKDTRTIALNLGLLGADRGVGGEAKPTVMDFYASWCRPCKQLQPLIEEYKSRYGDQVNFVSINVDDPNNEQVVEQYEVSPIPTLVFLSSDGEVVSYSIGYSGEQSLSTGLKKILKAG